MRERPRLLGHSQARFESPRGRFRSGPPLSIDRLIERCLSTGVRHLSEPLADPGEEILGALEGS